MSTQRTAVRHATNQHRSESKAGRGGRRRHRRGPSPIAVAGVVVVLLAAMAAFLTLSRDDTSGRETANVVVTGAPLPPDGDGTDAAVGRAAPELKGVDFGGHPVAIGNDGRPKAIMLLAHWCPHCQREVPKVVRWLEQTGGVPGVDVYALSTWASRSKPNWPPSAWFERERWTAPVLVDDASSSAAQALGLTRTPLWVLVRADGTVAKRVSGAVAVEQLEVELRALVAAPQPAG